MHADQIYILETIIQTIELQPNISINDKDGVTIKFKFAEKVNFDINTQYFSSPVVEDEREKNIDMNYGKTFLFVSKPSDLRQLLQEEPYEITLLDGNKIIGTTIESWKNEFSEMVKFFETLGIVKSTALDEWFNIFDDKNVKTARLKIFMRMSCCGTNVQTLFQIKTGEEQQQEFIFRQRNISRTFKVNRFPDERCQPIIAPLYSAVTDPRSGQESLVNLRENASLTQLFDRENIGAKTSGDDMDGFGQDYDVVSICYTPTDNKFFEMLNIISANVKPEKDTEITLQRSRANRVESLLRCAGGNIKENPNIVINDDQDNDLRSTADKISKRLCGNKDCPVSKKFKKYGIGPLATEKNLGTLYGSVEPHVTYGMSHTYGTMANYGPFGIFATPEEEEKVAEEEEKVAEEEEKVSEAEAPSAQEPVAEPVKPCKMRKKEKKKKPQWHSKTCPLCPDRLRGGSDDGVGQSIDNGDGLTCMPKSPMIECKSVMEQFDSILAEYKKALGPCGHPTCPYSQTLAEDACKKSCEQPALPSRTAVPENRSSMSCNDIPCDMDDCPYGSEPKKKRYPAGCGNPKCAYTKYKLGLVDDDAEIELQFLPPALGGNCGSPHCKYPLEPPLPPIHWDCPEPLPKGPCKNLNCPFQPRPLKKFKTKKQLKTGPCGSPMCPYALPQPCSIPTCPFGMQPCPMKEAQRQTPKKEKCPSSDENLCENLDCPFAEANAKKTISDEVDDPKFKGEFQDCENPDCPYKKKDKKKKPKNKHKEDACDNPACPSNKPPKKDKKKKKKCPASEDSSNPECISNQEKEKKSKRSPCDNTDCPFGKSEKQEKKKKKKDKNGSNDSDCSNADCPAKKKKDKNRCLKSSSESVSVCSDPDCPYAELKNLKKSKSGKGGGDDTSCGKGDDTSCGKGDDSVCSNPECPEQSAREQEDNGACIIPGCPYSPNPPKSSVCRDPKCPYLSPLPSCGIPNCPYEPVPVRFFCKNPKCPSRKIDFSKNRSKLGPSTDIVNGDKKRISQDQSGRKYTGEVLKTTTVCEDPCEKPQDCENPDCEMTGDKDETSAEKKALAVKQQKKKGNRKNKGKFVYSIGDKYPGTKLGHRECVMPVFNVPPNMGWLWNIFTPIMSLKPRRGWRPGALTRTMAARIRAHRQAKGLGQLMVPTFKSGLTHDDENGDPKVVPKPTLQIQKKEGAYWITMNPLKDPFGLVENEDPYMECTPMTFKITKPKKQDDDYCCCDGEEPPENMSSSSSDSELDIEFTPPAGIIHPERFKKKPNIACCDTQYDPKDFEVQKKEKEVKGKDKKGGKGGKGDKKGKKKK